MTSTINSDIVPQSLIAFNGPGLTLGLVCTGFNVLYIYIIIYIYIYIYMCSCHINDYDELYRHGGTEMLVAYIETGTNSCSA